MIGRGLNLEAVRARIDRLAIQATERADAPLCLAELILGRRLDDADPTLTLEDMVAASWRIDR